MGRNRELPAWLATVSPSRALPLHAELTVSLVVIALIAVLDLRSAIGVSGVAVLTYYAITNAAALTLGTHERRWPRALGVAGLIGCLTLIVTLPWQAVVTGVGALMVGVVVRLTTAGPERRSARGRARRGP